MKRNLNGSLLVVLMFILQSWALSLQAPDEILVDAPEAMEVIPAPSALNAPGFHQGSIFSEATLAAGGHHTCAILDNMSISCWGDDSEGQLGNGLESSIQYVPDSVLWGVNQSIGLTPLSISAGFAHTCVLAFSSYGSGVSCWGDNSQQQVSPSWSSSNLEEPSAFVFFSYNGVDPVALDSGDDHSCVILSNGNISCWGANNRGQIGASPTQYPSQNPQYNYFIDMSSFGHVKALGLGGDHSCALVVNGSVACWGNNSVGQLGRGYTNAYDDTPWYVQPFGQNRKAVAIAAGGNTTCALLDDGAVSCWGAGDYGQLGNNNTASANTPQEVSSFPGDQDAVSVAVGWRHGCVLLSDQNMSCWGNNIVGQLGNNNTTNSTTPVLVQPLNGTAKPVALTLNNVHTCALLDDGNAACWGYGYRGALGIGLPESSAPVAVDVVSSPIRDIDAGGWHTCSVLNNGSVVCWGDNAFLQVGSSSVSPANVSGTFIQGYGASHPASVVRTGPYHSCAIDTSGDIQCWGDGRYGQLGNGSNSASLLPVNVSLPTGAKAVDVALGIYHTCALLTNGSVMCWGDGTYGQLGAGWATTSSNTPVYTSALGSSARTGVAIDAGVGHTCVHLDDSSVVCWGYNGWGGVGSGSFTDMFVPTFVTSLGSGSSTTATSISTGYGHTCAITNNGLLCWGKADAGQLGDGQTQYNRATPQTVGSFGTGISAVNITAGWQHTCALLSNGNLSCWGGEEFGALGPTTLSSTSTPGPQFNLSTNGSIVKLTSTNAHTCALTSTNESWCWGLNNAGQLGDGTTLDRMVPALVSGFPGNLDIALPERDWDGNGVLNEQQALLDSNDSDGDGWDDDDDDFNTTLYRSVSCPPGKYGAYGCVDAHPGTYVQNAGSLFPTQAMRGNFVSGFGATNQTPCGLGTYQPIEGQTACIQADPGYFVSFTGASYQYDCGYGTYQPKAGQSSCLNADPGYFVTGYGQTFQTPCNYGTYQANSGRSYCDDAPPGYYVDTLGANASTPCPAGTYGTSWGATTVAMCSLAFPGSYVDTPGSSSVTYCPRGTYNPLTGANSSSWCLDADPGHYVDQQGQSGQEMCPPGTYNPSTGSTSDSDCLITSPGHYSPAAGQANQTPCPEGTYQPNTNSTACVDAGEGWYANGTGNTAATPCPSGTYNPNPTSSSAADCIMVEPGYYAPMVGNSEPVPCSTGTYQPLAGQASCLEADPGYFVQSYGQTNQTACEPGTYQNLPGQSRCFDADPGFYVNTTAASNQTACDAGSYQSASASTFCILTSPGHYTDAPGANYQKACPAGSYQPLGGMASCELADPGHFVEGEGKLSQRACQPGTYNPDEGGDREESCLQAEIGHYVPERASAQQFPCALGTYQRDEGMVACDDASVGHFVNSTGSYRQEACPLGFYQPAMGMPTCIEADLGHFVDSTGSRVQYECPFGTYQPEAGQSHCLLAPPGSYVDSSQGTAQSTTMLCPLGAYNPNEGGAKVEDCILASKGHYVGDLGQLEQQACTFGSYQPLEGAASCLLADQGYYVPFMTSITQIMCPEGTSTLERGAEDETFCLADFDGDGLPDVGDTDDDGDGVPDQIDAFPYDPKEQIDSDGDGIGDVQEAENQRQMLRMVVVFLLLLIGVAGAVVLRRRQQAPELPEIEAPAKPLPSLDELWANGPELPFPPLPVPNAELETPKLNPSETRYPLESWTENGYEWRRLSDGTLEWNNNGVWEVYGDNGQQATAGASEVALEAEAELESDALPAVEEEALVETLSEDLSEELSEEAETTAPEHEGDGATLEEGEASSSEADS